MVISGKYRHLNMRKKYQQAELKKIKNNILPELEVHEER